MAIEAAIGDRERLKFKEASSVSGQPGVVVINPDGSSVSSGTASTATITTVSNAVSSATALLAAILRKKAIFYNDSSTNVYLKYGTTASSTDFTVKIAPAGTWTCDSYTGRIDTIADAATGTLRITELT